MRFLYLDIDTLRPDHLGCYGYHRSTSPNIDALAQRSAVFENVHASDVPCLPSRTALLTGRFGIHNGVVNHGGTDADPVFDGAGCEFWSSLQLRFAANPPEVGRWPAGRAFGSWRGEVSLDAYGVDQFGLYVVVWRAARRRAVDPHCAQRHSAFHWYAGFDEAYNVGKFGLESADEVYAIAEDWLHVRQRRRGRRKGRDAERLDDWFLDFAPLDWLGYIPI